VFYLLPGSAARAQIYVVDFSAGTVGEYNTDGSTINSSLISGLSSPNGIAICGSTLFVTNESAGTVGEYTTSGDTVNAALISGLNQPLAIVVSGSNLYVSTRNGTVGEYTTAGATVNASLISGLSSPYFMVNASFLKGVSMAPSGIAVSGSDVYVASLSDFIGFGSIGEYTTTGTVVNGSLVGGLGAPHGIAVVVPDQPTDTPAMPLWGLAALGMLLVGAAVRLMRAPIRR
jgi:hypothetical protein